MVTTTIQKHISRIETLTTENDQLRSLLTELRVTAEAYANDPRPLTERALRCVILACKAVKL